MTIKITTPELSRIFVTRDRDYGNLVFVKGMDGVLYLRMLPNNQGLVYVELQNVLQNYTDDKLKSAFVVVEAGGQLFRKNYKFALSNRPPTAARR